MNKIFKSVSIVTISAIITRVLSFLFKIYLSRKVGAEILGVYQITISIFMLLACLSSGIPVTLSRMSAECFANNTIEKLKSKTTSALILSLSLAIIPIVILYFYDAPLKLIFSDIRCINIFYIILPMLISISIYSTLRSYLWGKKEFKIFAFAEIIDETSHIVIAIILFSLSSYLMIDDLYVYAIAMILGEVIIVIYLFIMFFKKGGRFAKPRHFKEIIKSSTPITISRILASILSSFLSIMIPMLLIRDFSLTSQEATAEYGRASGMVMSLIYAPNTILSSLNIVLIPEIATKITKGQLKDLTKKLNLALFITISISSIFMFIFIGVGKEIGELLFLDKKVGEYLVYASILVIPMGINGISTSILNSLKKETSCFYSYLFSSIFLVVIVYTTPKYLGIYSYFLALMVFHTINMIINIYLLNKTIYINTKTLFLSTIIIGCAILFGELILFIGNKISLSLILKTIILCTLIMFVLTIPLIYVLKKFYPMYKMKKK